MKWWRNGETAMDFPGALLREGVVSEQRRYLHVLALSYAQKAGLPEGERREFLSPADLSGKK